MAQKKASGKGKNTNTGKMYVKAKENAEKRYRVYDWVLFGVALLSMGITFIPGGSVWASVQSVIFGVFGLCAYLIPFLLIYAAVIIALDREKTGNTARIIETVVLILLICGAVYIFSVSKPFPGYKDGIGYAYDQGSADTVRGGGAAGGTVGGAFLAMTASKAAAAAIDIILMFIDVMLLTGATLSGFVNTFAKPAKKASDLASEHNEKRRQERELIKQQQEDEDETLPLNDSDGSHNSMFDFDSSGLKGRKAARISRGGGDPAIDVDLGPMGENTGSPAKKPARTAKAPLASVAPAVPAAAAVTAAAATVSPVPLSSGIDYVLPSISLLDRATSVQSASAVTKEMESLGLELIDVLSSFGVKTTLTGYSHGPSATRYEIAPERGTKLSKIMGLEPDIALNMGVSSVRIAPVAGKFAVGIELPNKNRETVTLRELIDSDTFRNAKSKVSVALGKDISGKPVCTDIAKMPHLLIAGTTGSGKSVCLNTMIMSILYHASPDEVKLIMIDPKQVEFSVYNGLPHLEVAVQSDAKKAAGTLNMAVKKMQDRYSLFAEYNVRDINGYKELCKKNKDMEPMPQIIIFIDELADLMMVAPGEVEDSICRLAQLARAAGIHLVVATQRPSVDVITGLIKANIPSRLALSVSSQVDSRTILDGSGAEKLLGNGDMLFDPVGCSKPVRIQGCYVSDQEIARVVSSIKEQTQAQYNEEEQKLIDDNADMLGSKKSKGGANSSDSGASDDRDDLFDDAVQVVLDNKQASTTLLQRKLKVGYARAARIMDELEEEKIIGPYEGSKPRSVLINKNDWMERKAMSSDDPEPEE